MTITESLRQAAAPAANPVTLQMIREDVTQILARLECLERSVARDPTPLPEMEQFKAIVAGTAGAVKELRETLSTLPQTATATAQQSMRKVARESRAALAEMSAPALAVIDSVRRLEDAARAIDQAATTKSSRLAVLTGTLAGLPSLIATLWLAWRLGAL